jgi:hypothetical protein
MLHYLFNAYGNIIPLKLDATDTMMKEQWDPSTSIIYLFSRIQDGVDKSDAGDASYTVNQVLTITFSRHNEICMQTLDIPPAHEQDMGKLSRNVHVSA